MYVATPQGYRRRIGPRSRYGTTPDEPAYQRTSQRVGSSPQRVGSSNSGLDEHFGSEAGRRRKELDERYAADKFLADKEKRRAKQARKSEQTAKATSSATSAATTAAAGATGGPVAAGIHSVLAGLRSSSDLASRQRQAAEDRAWAAARIKNEKRIEAGTTAAENRPESKAFLHAELASSEARERFKKDPSYYQ